MVDDPLKKLLRTYCDVNAMEMLNLLPEKLRHYDIDLVKDQLRDAIEGDTLTIEEYESLTNDYYESNEELKDWLKELWGIMFEEQFKN